MNEKVVRTLAVLRKKAGLNQTSLAAQLRLNQVDISIQENSDTVVIRRDAFDALGELFNVNPPEDLLLPYEEFILKHGKGAA